MKKFYLFLTLAFIPSIGFALSPLKKRKSFVKIIKDTEFHKGNTVIKGRFIFLGSGFIVGHQRTKSFVITNRHVCLSRRILFEKLMISRGWTPIHKIYGIFQKGKYRGKLVKFSLKSDLCLLQFKKIPFPALKISRKEPKIGDKLFVIANPLGSFHPSSVPWFYGYYFSNEETGLGKAILVSIPCTKGCSGSPILNAKGKVVSVLFGGKKYFPFISLGVTFRQLKLFYLKYFLKRVYHVPITKITINP